MQDYIKKAIRTDLGDYQPMIDRMNKSTGRLLHGAIGIATESGELLDALKRHLMYGKDLDRVNMGEEIGDLCWYMAIVLDELGLSFEDVMQKNIAKLSKRYPEKFTEHQALHRDLVEERKTLEV